MHMGVQMSLRVSTRKLSFCPAILGFGRSLQLACPCLHSCLYTYLYRYPYPRCAHWCICPCTCLCTLFIQTSLNKPLLRLLGSRGAYRSWLPLQARLVHTHTCKQTCLSSICTCLATGLHTHSPQFYISMHMSICVSRRTFVHNLSHTHLCTILPIHLLFPWAMPFKC